MEDLSAPAPDQAIGIEIKNLPVRLWWKLMETAQTRGIPLSYLIFQILVEAVGYDGEEEPYDLVVREIKKTLEG
jgi:hypothetical protein